MQKNYLFSSNFQWQVIESLLSCNAIDQFKLTTSFKNYAITNRTYSWRAAWFSKHPEKKVVAPYKWINMPSFRATNFFLLIGSLFNR